MATVFEESTEHKLAEVRERVTDVVEKALGREVAERLNDRAERAVRQARHGLHRATDVLDDTAHCIKRQPLTAVAVTFAAGVVIGGVVIGAAAFGRAVRRTR